MDINELKDKFEEIIHSYLYNNSTLSEEMEKTLDNIKEYLKNSKTAVEDIRVLLSTKNNENYFAYYKYIKDFIVELDISIKLEILNKQNEYEDILKDEDILLNIWKSLDNEEKVNYLNNKKNYTTEDILLINKSLNENNEFSTYLLQIILKDKELKDKIGSFTINLNCSDSLLSIIDLNNYDECFILSRDSYTNFLLKKYRTFDEFFELYENNKKIFNLINNNSLVFPSIDNNKIYNFLIENPNFIGKFNTKYLDLLNLIEIDKISKIKNLDSDAFSSIIQRQYKLDNENASKYFTENNLLLCPKHSINVYPFDYLDDNQKNKIFQTYNLFNKFIDTIMIEAINDNFSEEDIVNILRDDSFINDMSSYAIELLINKLSFKSAFNMLQRKIIFDRINNLHIKVEDKDALFIKGYLESPVLVHKTEHNMLYEMLKLLNDEDLYYYISLPYIMNNLSSYEIIGLLIEKNINIHKVFEIEEIKNKFNTIDIVNFIDKYFEKEIDLSIFKNKDIVSKIFNLSYEVIDNINFDEVNYLYETIRMKAILSKQEYKVTVLSYKSCLIAYLVLGLEETLNLVSNGNMNLTLNDVKNLQYDIVNEKILLFKENNSAIFQNMAKKILNSLKKIERNDDINEFAKSIRKNTYLDNIIYLMLDNGYDSYNNIVEKFFNYIKYGDYDNYHLKKDIYDYANGFVSLFISNKVNQYNNEFEKIILKNFRLKEKILYNERKKLGKCFLRDLKFKLFVRSLTDPNKESYSAYYEDNFDVKSVKEKYIKYLANKDVDFNSILEHVLTPIVNERFDKENCLNKLGIIKPKNTDIYNKYLNDIKNVDFLNNKIENYKKTYSEIEILAIMNCICYKQELGFKVNNKFLKELTKLANIIDNLGGEIYVDKSTLNFVYKDNIDIYNIEEIMEYNNYLDILNNIINKTYKYVDKHISTDKVQNSFAHDYFKALSNINCIFPITNRYYELKKRVLSIKDIEKIFKGYDISKFKTLDENLKYFLFNKKNLLMVVDGYYDGIVDNLGTIISNWDNIINFSKEFDVNINDLTLIKVENILTMLSFNNNPLAKIFEKSLVKSIYEDSYYMIDDLNRRIMMLIKLFKDSFKRVKSTVPYLSYIEDNYEIKILDNYNQDSFKTIKNSLYRVGSLGNDFLHYSILNKNGIQIGVYKDNILVGKILGVRNGNAVYLNILEGEKDLQYNDIFRNFATRLISLTKEDNESIDYVTIVNNDIYKSRNGLNIDTTICPIINDPINKIFNDFENFANNDSILNAEDIYTNYEDNISTLLANSDIVDKNNFKFYDAEDKYLRKRNDVIKLSNNIGEEYLNKVDAIMYLCKLEDNTINTDVHLSMINTIYLGDDFVLFVTEKNNYLKFVLPYDSRAIKEVEMIIKKIEETN